MSNFQYLFFDTETNGRTVEGNWTNKQEVIELCWIITDDKLNIVKENTYFIRDVAKEIYQGQTVYKMEDILKGETFENVFYEFLRDLRLVYANGGKAIAHNLSFDKIVLEYSAYLKDINVISIMDYKDIIDKIGICSKLKTTRFVKAKNKLGYIKWPKLTELYDKLFPNEPYIQTHKALDDVLMLLKCIKKCVDIELIQLTDTREMVLDFD